MVAGRVGSITTAAAAVSPDMLAKLWGEFDYRMDICSAGDTLSTSERYVKPCILKCTSMSISP